MMTIEPSIEEEAWTKEKIEERENHKEENTEMRVIDCLHLL